MDWQWYDPKLAAEDNLDEAEEEIIALCQKSFAMATFAQRLDRWLGMVWQEAVNTEALEHAKGIHRAKVRLQELMQRAYPDK